MSYCVNILGVKIPKYKICNKDIFPENQIEWLVSLYELDSEYFCIGKIESYIEEDEHHRLLDEILRQLYVDYSVIPYTHPKFLDKYNFGRYNILEDGGYKFEETY